MKKITIIALFILLSVNMFAAGMSKAGKQNIMEHENCSLIIYKDNTGYSIGYGHRLKNGENYKKISKKKAEQLFMEDIKIVDSAINRIISQLKWTPSQNFIDGLGDLIYNCGEAGVKQSEFYTRLMKCRSKHGIVNKNDLNYTIAAVKTMRIPSKKSGCQNGVINRRYEVHKMML